MEGRGNVILTALSRVEIMSEHGSVVKSRTDRLEANRDTMYVSAIETLPLSTSMALFSAARLSSLVGGFPS